jgi:hypothetical protein
MVAPAPGVSGDEPGGRLAPAGDDPLYKRPAHVAAQWGVPNHHL